MRRAEFEINNDSSKKLMSNTESLNENVLSCIFPFLADNPFQLSLVCKRWHYVLRESNVLLWKSMLDNRWPSFRILKNLDHTPNPLVDLKRAASSIWKSQQCKKTHKENINSNWTIYDINSSASWKDLFIKLHRQSLHFVPELSRAMHQYAQTKQAEQLKSLSNACEQANHSQCISKLWNTPNLGDQSLQFIVDSALYGYIYHRKEYRLENRRDDSEEAWLTFIYGTILSLSGSTLPFCTVFHTSYIPGGGGGDAYNHVAIGQYKLFDCDMGEETPENWRDWLKNVRILLGIENKPLLDVWRVIEAIMLPRNVRLSDALWIHLDVAGYLKSLSE